MASSPNSLMTSHNNVKNATSRSRTSRMKNNFASMRSITNGDVKKHENDVVSSRSDNSSSSMNSN